jgi:hypothetical protein
MKVHLQARWGGGGGGKGKRKRKRGRKKGKEKGQGARKEGGKEGAKEEIFDFVPEKKKPPFFLKKNLNKHKMKIFYIFLIYIFGGRGTHAIK